jgi:NAD(P)-dependent dehydrogenase (short-subunit alcohol dehydrogenase family)
VSWDRALPELVRKLQTTRPEEIGFLASPAAAYITGVSLPVDGGRIAAI